jgi:peroxiredoxin Q/BCP
MILGRRILGWAVLTIVLAVCPAMAVEVGAPAPEFKLPGTTGADIALSDFRGKKWVLLEFYGVDFAPT